MVTLEFAILTAARSGEVLDARDGARSTLTRQGLDDLPPRNE